MAIDTERKRRAAANFLLTPWFVLPTADGTINAFDRGTALGVYPQSKVLIRKQIRDAISYGLSTITTDNGYNTNIGDRYVEPTDFERAVNLPAVQILWGREVYLNAEPGGSAMGFLMKRAQVFLEFYFRDINNPSTTRNKLLADVEKYFMNNRWIPNSGGVGTAIDCMLVRDVPFGFDATSDKGGISIEMNVWYKQSINNPYATNFANPTSQSGAFKSSPDVSIKDEMRKAVKLNIEAITKSAGYNYDWSASATEVDPSKFVNLPMMNLGDMVEEYRNSSNFNLQDRRLHKVFDANFDCYYKDVNDPQYTREKMLADIEQRFLTYFYLPDGDGNRTVFSLMPVFNVPFGIEGTGPRVGIQIGMRFWYRQDILNPKSI